jgi:hypothetical protein
MSNKSTNPQFLQHVSDLAKQINEGMSKGGFQAKIAKIIFHPMDATGCKCGQECTIDPITHQVKCRCKRCPPATDNE